MPDVECDAVTPKGGPGSFGDLRKIAEPGCDRVLAAYQDAAGEL